MAAMAVNHVAYYLGIDAGGTKTHCLIGDDSGHLTGFGKGGPGNYEVDGVAAARAQIERALHEALDAASVSLNHIAGIGLGIAGADLPEDYDMLEAEIFGPLFGDKPRVFRNDSMGGLRGGTRRPYGIVIACGTGCVCAGVNPGGAETRVGGISEEFGDRISGSSIGSEGLRAVWRAREGVVPPTLMTGMFVRRANCRDVDELFTRMYRNEIAENDLQPMAKIVFDAAYEGDAVACDILEWGGRYLGDMVIAVARQLDMPSLTFDVVMAGSVFKGRSAVLADTLRTRVHRVCPNANTIMPEFEPVVGAFLLGVELDHTMDSARYDALAASIDATERRFGVQLRST